ncbi:hypothetical protein WJX81_004015 [Elliptochloris bilobata]|uniref:Sec16 Sec23-binding domain-containing protein n=1 Tax=Elliptochloris bilobata TaxID=381761 RepID=A0AAW1R2R6_9CHLO
MQRASSEALSTGSAKRAAGADVDFFGDLPQPGSAVLHLGFANTAGDDSASFFDDFDALGTPRNAAAQPSTFGLGDEALRSPAGRPPCAAVAWGFGGRVVLLQPALGYGPAALGAPSSAGPAAGQLSRLHVRELVAHLSAAGGAPPGDSGGSLSDDLAALEAFPGPLTTHTPRDKVAACLSELECRAAAAEAAGGASSAGAAALWGALRIMACHGGALVTPPGARAAKGAERLEVQLAAAISPGGAAGSPAPGELAATAAAVQALLVGGQRTEALRVACEGQLWGPALLLARQLGEGAFVDTAAAMAAALGPPGAPLRTLTLVLAGRPDAALPPPRSAATTDSRLNLISNPEGPGSGLGDEAAAAAVLDDWRRNLAALAANRSPGDEVLLVRLGDRLWLERGMVAAAHLCYLLAGQAPAWLEPGARLCLPGGDHSACPRTFASTAALQAAEVAEWARSLGGAAQSRDPAAQAAVAAAAGALLPWKLVYAARLAEAGHPGRAAHYVASVQAALAGAGRLPGRLLIARALAGELEERIARHCAAHNISVQPAPAGSLVAALSGWLDKGINKLIGGSDLPGSGPAALAEADRRSASEPGSPRWMGRQHGRSNSSADVAGAAMLGKVPSLSSFLGGGGGGGGGGGAAANGSSGGASGKREAKLGEENKFFYDEELKCWRERGAAAPILAPPPPPPPAATAAEPPAAAPPTGEAEGVQRGGLPPPSSSGSGPDPDPATAAVRRSSVRGRYVDVFNAGASGPSSTPAPAVPLVPGAVAGG